MLLFFFFAVTGEAFKRKKERLIHLLQESSVVQNLDFSLIGCKPKNNLTYDQTFSIFGKKSERLFFLAK